MSRKSKKERRQKKQMQAIIIVAAAVLIGLAALLIGAAAGNENLGEHDHDHEHTSKKELKIGVAFSESDTHYQSLLKFKETVEEKTGGNVKVSIFSSGKLGKDKELVNSLQQKEHSADIIVTKVDDFTDADPRMDISTLPFLFDGYEAAWTFVEGNAQESIEDDLVKKNIRVLAHYCDGFDYMTTARQAITKSADLKNLTFAVDKGSQMLQVMESLEGTARPVEQDAISHALGANVYDGYIGNLKTIYDSKIYQMQGHLAVTYHSYNALAFAISEETWDSLDETQQKIVKDAAEESAGFDRNNQKQMTDRMLGEMQAAGMKVSYPVLSGFVREVEGYISSNKEKYGDLFDDVMKNIKE